MDASKIQPILDYAQPKTVKDVRHLLGLGAFYQKFIKQYSDIATPISDLLKGKRKKNVWTQEANQAFEKMKNALVAAPVLANADFHSQFIIETDSSDLAVGAVLTQEEMVISEL